MPLSGTARVRHDIMTLGAPYGSGWEEYSNSTTPAKAGRAAVARFWDLLAEAASGQQLPGGRAPQPFLEWNGAEGTWCQSERHRGTNNADYQVPFQSVVPLFTGCLIFVFCVEFSNIVGADDFEQVQACS